MTNKTVVINPKVLFGRKRQEMTLTIKGRGIWEEEGRVVYYLAEFYFSSLG